MRHLTCNQINNDCIIESKNVISIHYKKHDFNIDSWNYVILERLEEDVMIKCSDCGMSLTHPRHFSHHSKHFNL